MTQRSDFASALQDLRILEGEPGVQMRWQGIIRAAITAMEGVQELIPIETPPAPLAETKKPEAADDVDAEAANGDAFDHDGDGKVGGSKPKPHVAASHHKGK